MDVTSLGFRTDLALLTASGSVVEDRGTHLVVRTPDNPTYYWGNFILLSEPPVPGGQGDGPSWDSQGGHSCRLKVMPLAAHNASIFAFSSSIVIWVHLH